MTYILRNSSANEIGRSETAIVLEADQARSRDETWLNLPPGCYVEEAPDSPPVPEEVTARQAFRAIYQQLGKTEDDLLALVAAQPEPARTLMSIDIRKSNTFRRDNPTLATLAQVLGLTSAQVDGLFIFAEAS